MFCIAVRIISVRLARSAAGRLSASDDDVQSADATSNQHATRNVDDHDGVAGRQPGRDLFASQFGSFYADRANACGRSCVGGLAGMVPSWDWGGARWCV